MPVTIKTVALRYRDQEGEFQEADCLKGTDATVTVIHSNASELTLDPYPVTYDFGTREALTVTVTTASRYKFMLCSASGMACHLTMNGVDRTTGTPPTAGCVTVVDIWNGIAVMNTYEFGELPSTYTRKDFVVTSGHNARFDSGVNGNNDHLTIEFDTESVTAPTSANNPILGSCDPSSASLTAWCVGPATDVKCYSINTNIRSYTYGSMANTNVQVTSGSHVGLRVFFRLTFAHYHFKTLFATRDVDQDYSGATHGAGNIAIGAGGTMLTGGSGTSRIYSCRIIDNGNVIRDYVPCIRNSDGVAGLFDLVYRTFNPSTGTVAFTAGNL